MSSHSLKEALQTLECHFTWSFLSEEELSAAHILQTLSVRVQHTAYRNRGVYLAMRAYLQQTQGHYTEALSSLQEAERVLKEDHPTNFSRQVLVTYGNYAWIYYHLANYEMVQLYLDRIWEIYQSLSSLEPFSVQIPEIYAQKAWSLLAVGFQNGEEAQTCFHVALQGDKFNRDYQVGLAISLCATWTRSQRSDHWKEAKRLMEKFHRSRPLNNEVQVHLASLLEKTDWRRAERLLEGAVQSSLDPEVLRNAAVVYKPHSLLRAISILQQGLTLTPTFSLLHYDLGVCYTKQMEEAATPEEREEVLPTAIDSFKRAVEMDPRALFPRLELAKMYGEKAPLHAEEIFQNLNEELWSFSKQCQQIFCLFYGDFLLHKKGLTREAQRIYEVGLTLPGGCHKEWQQLRGRLEALTEMSREDIPRKGSGSLSRPQTEHESSV